jgi:hypothetical protein
MSEHFFDYIVLVGMGDGGDDLHPLATGFANFWIGLPDFGDQPGPVLAPKPNELRVLLGGDDVGRYG